MAGIDSYDRRLCSGSGSTEVQIARPIPDISARGPTVSWMAAIPTKGVPGRDQYRVLTGGSLREAANFVGQTSKKLPLNWRCRIHTADAGSVKIVDRSAAQCRDVHCLCTV